MSPPLAILRRGLRLKRLVACCLALAALGAIFLGWLRLPDSTWWYLVLQAVIGAALLAGAGALLALTVASLAGDSRALSGGRRRWRRILAGAAVVVLAAFLYRLAGWVQAYVGPRVWTLPSWLTYHLRHPIPVRPFQAAWSWIVLCVQLAVIPAFAVGLVSRWLHGPSRRRNAWLFWGVAIALAALGDWLPWHIAWWVPHFYYGWSQALSAGLRLAVAAILFGCGLVVQWSWYVGQRGDSVSQESVEVPAASDG